MALSEAELIYDWNRAGEAELRPARGRVELNDETLRDGLQSPSVRTPSIEQKVAVLHDLVALGIDALDLGLPGAGPHVVKDVLALAQEIARHKLPIAANCAARTVEADIRPIVEISQQVGMPIEAACFSTAGQSTIPVPSGTSSVSGACPVKTPVSAPLRMSLRCIITKRSGYLASSFTGSAPG